MKDLHILPKNLPVPIDDGACAHLLGSRIPAIALRATSGHSVDLSTYPGWLVVYFIPCSAALTARHLWAGTKFRAHADVLRRHAHSVIVK